MAIKDRSEMSSERTIDLSGPDGNAFYLLGVAGKWSDQLDRDTTAILDEMRSGDYENLVAVFDREFGEFVTLYR